MTITHIMADGSTRQSVEGIVIRDKNFYAVIRGIAEKRKKS
jgi:hypothetical protein